MTNPNPRSNPDAVELSGKKVGFFMIYETFEKGEICNIHIIYHLLVIPDHTHVIIHVCALICHKNTCKHTH